MAQLHEIWLDVNQCSPRLVDVDQQARAGHAYRAWCELLGVSASRGLPASMSSQPRVARSFVHLHCHSEYSILDGAAPIGSLVAEVERLGMPAVAVTDHGTMSGVYELWQRSKRSGVKPIAGIEAYIAPGSRHHKKPVLWGRAGQRGSDEYGGDVSGGGAYTHMTMLAADATGLRNLFRLSSLASFEGFYKKPRMDRELIAQYSGGVIATTGCPSGEVQTRLRLGQHTEALQAAADYRDIFGAGEFYLELMDHGLVLERSVRDDLLDIGRRLGLKPVATNDSHYVRQGDAHTHDALLCVQTKTTLSTPGRFRFGGEGYYLKSPSEMRDYWDTEVPGAAENTLVIAERIDSYDEVFTPADRTPGVPLRPGDTEDGLLRAAVTAGAAARFPTGLATDYQHRLDAELAVIARMGFASYFLVVADVAGWAKEKGIACRGRGSAAGSLVAYVLGITDLDPLVHGLMFERFMNPDRVSPPDIDLDVHEHRRGEILRYLTQRWGSANVAQVTTFGTIKTKAAIKDAARVLYGQPGFTLADKITKALPPPIFAVDIPLSGVFDPTHERYSEAARVRDLTESTPQVAAIMDLARGLEGLTRNVGVHACGVILSSQPLLDVLPLWQRPEDKAIVTGWDFGACEQLGLLKVDVLGSRTLAVIEAALTAIEANHGVRVNLATVSLEDPLVYELLSRGETLGVFQLDSGGARELSRRVKPTRFEDIPAMLALYRPGPLAAGAHHDYAERANGRQEIRPIHPELAEPLAEILEATYGLCVYQEDVMAIARRVAGYTLTQADLLRRAMGKKKKEILDKEYEGFRAGMAANGYSAQCTRTLWNVLVPFSSYAFVRSHAVSYGLVSYWTAWLKAHYPAEFMAAQLTSLDDSKDRSTAYLAECRRLGIKVLPPDVNESGADFTATASGVRFGLAAIRNVGTAAIAAVINARDTQGRFTSFTDFLEKIPPVCCTKRTIESLIKAGAFDSLGHTRMGLHHIHEGAVDAAVRVKRRTAIGQPDLFGTETSLHYTPHTEEWPLTVLRELERDMLGLSLSGHPAKTTPPSAPLVLNVTSTQITPRAVSALRTTLRTHRGTTPVRLLLSGKRGETRLAVDDYPVSVTPALIADIARIPGITVMTS